MLNQKPDAKHASEHQMLPYVIRALPYSRVEVISLANNVLAFFSNAARKYLYTITWNAA